MASEPTKAEGKWYGAFQRPDENWYRSIPQARWEVIWNGRTVFFRREKGGFKKQRNVGIPLKLMEEMVGLAHRASAIARAPVWVMVMPAVEKEAQT